MDKIIEFKKKEKLHQRELSSIFKNIEKEIHRYYCKTSELEDITMQELVSFFYKQLANFEENNLFLTNKQTEKFIYNINELSIMDEEEDINLLHELLYILCSKVNRNIFNEDKEYVKKIINSFSNFLYEEIDLKQIRYTLNMLINNNYLKEKAKDINNNDLFIVIVEDIYNGVPIYYIISRLDKENLVEEEINEFTIENIYNFYINEAIDFISLYEIDVDELISEIEKIKIIDTFNKYSKLKFINIIKRIYNLEIDIKNHLSLILNLTLAIIELQKRHILSRVSEEDIESIVCLATINKKTIYDYMKDFYRKKDEHIIKLKKGGKNL